MGRREPEHHPTRLGLSQPQWCLLAFRGGPALRVSHTLTDGLQAARTAGRTQGGTDAGRRGGVSPTQRAPRVTGTRLSLTVPKSFYTHFTRGSLRNPSKCPSSVRLTTKEPELMGRAVVKQFSQIISCFQISSPCLPSPGDLGDRWGGLPLPLPSAGTVRGRSGALGTHAGGSRRSIRPVIPITVPTKVTVHK